MNRGLKFKIIVPIIGGFLVVLTVLTILAINITGGEIGKIGEDKGKTLSKITAESLMSSLMFEDLDSCKTNLVNLKKDEAVIAAEVFTKDFKSAVQIYNIVEEDAEKQKEKEAQYKEVLDTNLDMPMMKALKDEIEISEISIGGHNCQLFTSRIVNSDSKDPLGVLRIALSLESVEAATGSITLWMSFISFASLIVIGIIGFWIISKMIAPLIDASDMMEELSEGEGDLTVRLEVNTNDEIGELAANFNRFIENLRDIIMQVKDAST
ncbi:MAG: HAMP domain-containing protein, partial [bacterium]|nr:HAMP domain-containing protein [bacterium]